MNELYVVFPQNTSARNFMSSLLGNAVPERTACTNHETDLGLSMPKARSRGMARCNLGSPYRSCLKSKRLAGCSNRSRIRSHIPAPVHLVWG